MSHSLCQAYHYSCHWTNCPLPDGFEPERAATERAIPYRVLSVVSQMGMNQKYEQGEMEGVACLVVHRHSLHRAVSC